MKVGWMLDLNASVPLERRNDVENVTMSMSIHETTISNLLIFRVSLVLILCVCVYFVCVVLCCAVCSADAGQFLISLYYDCAMTVKSYNRQSNVSYGATD